jgi:hypothetical protein
MRTLARWVTLLLLLGGPPAACAGALLQRTDSPQSVFLWAVAGIGITVAMIGVASAVFRNEGQRAACALTGPRARRTRILRSRIARDVPPFFGVYKAFVLTLIVLAMFFATALGYPTALSDLTLLRQAIVSSIATFGFMLLLGIKIAMERCDAFSLTVLSAARSLRTDFDLRTQTPRLAAQWVMVVRFEDITLFVAALGMIPALIHDPDSAPYAAVANVFCAATYFWLYHRFLRQAYDHARQTRNKNGVSRGTPQGPQSAEGFRLDRRPSLGFE